MPVISARFIWASIVGRFRETPTLEHRLRRLAQTALQWIFRRRHHDPR